MAYKYNGDSILGVSLTVETPKPLDSRSVVNNLDDLYSIPSRYAYQGMTVANIDNGNIYMLLDKSKINEKDGWKASYESIQIISCSQEEYDALLANTTEDFKPIDPTKDYLHSEIYYYIYEEDTGQYYLSSAWGKQIEEQLSKKAANDAVVSLLQKLNSDIANLADNYTTTAKLEANYVLLTQLDSTDPTSLLSTALDKYYTKVQVDNIFITKALVEDEYVTKESLRGGGTDPGDDDFIFVTQNKYSTDQAAAKQQIDTKVLKTNEASTSSLIIYKSEEKGVEQIVSQEEYQVTELDQIITSQVKLTTIDNKILANDKPLSLEEDVPKVVCVDQPTYDDLVENNKTQEDTYYFTYGEKSVIDTGYVSSELLAKEYYNKEEVDQLIQDAIAPLLERIKAMASIDNNKEQLTIN